MTLAAIASSLERRQRLAGQAIELLGDPVALGPLVGWIVPGHAIRIGGLALLVALLEFAPVEHRERKRHRQSDQTSEHPEVIGIQDRDIHGDSYPRIVSVGSL